MTYKFDIEMSATITDSVAMDIIVAAVEQQTGKKVTNVHPTYNGTQFNGFQIIFDSKTHLKAVPFKPSKEFILTNFDEN